MGGFSRRRNARVQDILISADSRSCSLLVTRCQKSLIARVVVSPAHPLHVRFGRVLRLQAHFLISSPNSHPGSEEWRWGQAWLRVPCYIGLVLTNQPLSDRRSKSYIRPRDNIKSCQYRQHLPPATARRDHRYRHTRNRCRHREMTAMTTAKRYRTRCRGDLDPVHI